MTKGNSGATAGSERPLWIDISPQRHRDTEVAQRKTEFKLTTNLLVDKSSTPLCKGRQPTYLSLLRER